MLTSEACCETVRSLLATGESDVGLLCEELLDLSLEAGSTDNISAVVVALPGAKIGETQGEGLRARREAREEARREEKAREAAEREAELAEQKAKAREMARAHFAREAEAGGGAPSFAAQLDELQGAPAHHAASPEEAGESQPRLLSFAELMQERRERLEASVAAASGSRVELLTPQPPPG